MITSYLGDHVGDYLRILQVFLKLHRRYPTSAIFVGISQDGLHLGHESLLAQQLFPNNPIFVELCGMLGALHDHRDDFGGHVTLVVPRRQCHVAEPCTEN